MLGKDTYEIFSLYRVNPPFFKKTDENGRVENEVWKRSLANLR